MKIALKARNDKRIQSIDSIETCIWHKLRSSMQERRNQI